MEELLTCSILFLKSIPFGGLELFPRYFWDVFELFWVILSFNFILLRIFYRGTLYECSWVIKMDDEMCRGWWVITSWWCRMRALVEEVVSFCFLIGWRDKCVGGWMCRTPWASARRPFNNTTTASKITIIL